MASCIVKSHMVLLVGGRALKSPKIFSKNFTRFLSDVTNGNSQALKISIVGAPYQKGQVKSYQRIYLKQILRKHHYI